MGINVSKNSIIRSPKQIMAGKDGRTKNIGSIYAKKNGLLRKVWQYNPPPPGRFVACSEDTILISDDAGITWTIHKSPGTMTLLCFGEGKFIGTNKFYKYTDSYYSSDGINWTKGANLSTGTDNILAMVYCDGGLIIVCGKSSIDKLDPITNGPVIGYIYNSVVTMYDAIHAENKAVIVGNIPAQTYIYVAFDGEPFGNAKEYQVYRKNFSSVSYGKGIFFFDNGICYTKDFNTFIENTNQIPEGVKISHATKMVYDNGRFVVISRKDLCSYYSFDGLSWLKGDSITFCGINPQGGVLTSNMNLSCGGGNFVCTGYIQNLDYSIDSFIIYSKDGASWTLSSGYDSKKSIMSIAWGDIGT